jgi:bifunctional non-homologous end joining protein LigD
MAICAIHPGEDFDRTGAQTRSSVSPERVQTAVDGRKLSLTNLEKVLYPKSGFTKGEMIDYYARVAEVMIPHIKDRPITLKRFPNGVDGTSFFEKHAPKHLPDWIRTAKVPSKSASHEPINFVVICDRPGLIWAANLAALELHVPLWRVDSKGPLPAPPDYMVFDLDPGPGTTIVDCCRVARWISDRLGEDRLFPKTSGSKGIQIYMPLSKVTSEQASEQAHDLAKAIEKDHPDSVVSLMRKDLRNGKVLIDWSQNNPSKTTVAVYSLRAREDPTVSTPVTWGEVNSCAKGGNPNDLRFEASNTLQRVEKLGDLMEPLLALTGGRSLKSSRT